MWTDKTWWLFSCHFWSLFKWVVFFEVGGAVAKLSRVWKQATKSSLACLHLCYTTGVARLFWLRAKFKNYFSLRASLFEISDDKVTILRSRYFFLVLLMLLLSVFDQIYGSRRSMLLFLITEKGPRAAKKVGGLHAARGPHFGHVWSITNRQCSKIRI